MSARTVNRPPCSCSDLWWHADRGVLSWVCRTGEHRHGQCEARALIVGEGAYLATEHGHIVTLCPGRRQVLRPYTRGKGYGRRARQAHVKVDLRSKGAGQPYVHALVCAAWHGPQPDLDYVVLHLDDDPTNNAPSNLAWGTPSQNRRMVDDREGVLAEIREQRALADVVDQYLIDPDTGF